MERIQGISSPVAYLRAFLFTVYSFVSDLFSLMKPGVLTLLLVSTWCPMVLASKGTVSFPLVLLTLLGGALVSGSACGLNCWWERGTDALMERTKNRPLPAGRISPKTALIFSLSIGALGFLILWLYVNPLAALIALGGHLFYVFVYTIWLKPWTPQNIVIGGAAGAVPPLVGWAAVTGRVDLTAILLFLIVFLWTPPHFWALALNKNSDYQRAGIPMLPVVAGETVTHKQMFFYGLLLIPFSIFLVFSSEMLGWFSLVALSLLSAVFCFKIFQLKKLSVSAHDQKTRKAWDVFGFSLIYLAAFFVCLVVDSTVI